jgi:hypothetical protein
VQAACFPNYPDLQACANTKLGGRCGPLNFRQFRTFLNGGAPLRGQQ